MPTYVALDLETTGLSADNCEIIEVGAVKFTPEHEIATFHTAVKPSAPLSYFIQRLTGIHPDDLRDAPLFAEVASDLEDFLGDHPIVGQNVAFDLGFLAAQDIRRGLSFDTHELATLLLPGLPEYNLRSLARHFGIEFNVRHRALADAQAARAVFLRLRERLSELPVATLAELQNIAVAVDWPLRHLFAELLDEAPLLAEPGLPAEAAPLPVDLGTPLVARSPLQPVAADEVESIRAPPRRRPTSSPSSSFARSS